MNPSTGNGGTCYGDSGGPHFLGAGPSETTTIVSVTVTGDRFCRATDKTYRIDTASALSFLSEFVYGALTARLVRHAFRHGPSIRATTTKSLRTDGSNPRTR